MAWILRGLRDGIVTTRYPGTRDGYGDHHRGAMTVLPASPDSSAREPEPVGADPAGSAEVPARTGVEAAASARADPDSFEALCPTGAISVAAGELLVDRGRCIWCGRCARARPDRFAFDPSPEVAELGREALVVPRRDEDDEALDSLRSELAHKVRALRRSVHIRHVDAGSDGSEEWEVGALLNPVYDIQRLGIFFTASPRHADLLLVTGIGADAMAPALLVTYEAMAHPKIVVATGTDAVSGGIVRPSGGPSGGVTSILPVDVFIPGSPPSPFAILHGMLLGLGRLGPGRPGLGRLGRSGAEP